MNIIMTIIGTILLLTGIISFIAMHAMEEHQVKETLILGLVSLTSLIIVSIIH